MASPASSENRYIKYRGDSFLAESYHHSCGMRWADIHSVYELYFCPEALHHLCNICDNSYEFRHPTVILLKPYSIHSIFVDEPWPEGKNWFVISVSESTAEKAGLTSLLQTMLGDSMSLLYSLTQQQADYLASALRFLFHPDYPLEEPEALSVFAFFLSRLNSMTKTEQVRAIGCADFSVQQIMQYICENLSAPLTTEALSKQFSVSRSKLDRDFKASLGVTPKYFVELCRLHYAKQLLHAHQTLRISEIAQLCGFPSENYFYRFFRNRTGQTPNQFRNNTHKNSHL